MKLVCHRIPGRYLSTTQKTEGGDMGEATYYMTVRFKSPEEAAEKMPSIEQFLLRVAECADAWQAHRPHAKEEAVKADERLRETYPDVFEILGIVPPQEEQEEGQNWMGLNYLAGQLDSPLGEHSMGDGYVFTKGNEVRISGTVWHFADWDGLQNAMIEHFGAVDARWLSDEYVPVDYHDMLSEAMGA